MEATPGENDGSRAAPNLEDAAEWTRLVEAASVAGLLAAIESSMGAGLLARLTPEDVLQETLLQAWRDRGGHVWNGPRPFRAWLLTIAENRIRDASDQAGALKRGAGRVGVPLAGSGSSSWGGPGVAGWSPVVSTTPSRTAMHRERARVMVNALSQLPESCREIVRLRVFGQMSVERIAETVGLAASAVRHRLRSGAERYFRLLRGELSCGNSRDFTAGSGRDAAGEGSHAP